MPRNNEHTKLIVVKEGSKFHIKVYYSREGIKRFKTNIYVKDKAQFDKDKVFKKRNALHPDSFDDDADRLNEFQLKVETIICEFIAEHHTKPTAAQLEILLENYKENSQRSYTFIKDYLLEYTHGYDNKPRNSKSVIRALDSALTQFWDYKNRNFYFNEIDKKFIDEFIDFLLFYKPKRVTQATVGAKPAHKLTEPVRFDRKFGMNNNTLLKRLDAFMTFINWVIKDKNVKVDYNKIRNAINKSVKEKSIIPYANIEFAFRSMDEVKPLASPEFEQSITDDQYPEYINDVETFKGVGRDVLIRAKDYFIVSIISGNRVSDLRLIKEHHVKLKEQTAQKTKNQFLLNINDSAQELLRKHNFNMNMSDAKYNKCIKVFLKQFYRNYLKQEDRLVYQLEHRGQYEQVIQLPYFELAESHSGRRSFATIAYHSGKKKRTIMQFTGHTSEKEFDKYIQLKPEDDIKDFADLMSL